MGYKALLTLDLENGVSSEKREKFYEYLKKEKWSKLAGLTTAWKCSFNDDVTRESAIRVVKNDVAGAARHAGVSSYNAAVQVGKGEIEKF
ncbi:hypothetical protein L1D29_08810 [Shewanella insulae]|uniref:hypothetical protein n=1 Tax=Gammaproteobacteria TaxID=1236 RepID=UPI00119FC887|nr:MULTISPECIES: hypothetical protein [Gammaproteobacteria]MCG9712914.1 hypothetical protein [Shewanella insulae]